MYFVLMSSRFDVKSGVYRHSRPSPFTLSVKQKIANFEPLKVHEDQIFELYNILQKFLKSSKLSK